MKRHEPPYPYDPIGRLVVSFGIVESTLREVLREIVGPPAAEIVIWDSMPFGRMVQTFGALLETDVPDDYDFALRHKGLPKRLHDVAEYRNDVVHRLATADEDGDPARMEQEAERCLELYSDLSEIRLWLVLGSVTEREREAAEERRLSGGREDVPEDY